MLKEIRNHYGISQSAFASCLKIPRSSLSMAQSKRRDLPTTIQETLLPLYLAISQPATKGKNEKLATELAAQEKDWSRRIDRRKKNNEYFLIGAERKLVAMKEDQTRAIQILEAITSLKTKAKPKDMPLLNYIEFKARTLQKKTGMNSQLKLELKIHALKAELSFLNKAVRSF